MCSFFLTDIISPVLFGILISPAIILVIKGEGQLYFWKVFVMTRGSMVILVPSGNDDVDVIMMKLPGYKIVFVSGARHNSGLLFSCSLLISLVTFTLTVSSSVDLDSHKPFME